MKAMILAAGRGERMRPLTDETPKPLLPVAGKPLIVWQIERLRAAGIHDIIINHAYLGHLIEQSLGDGHQYQVHLQYSAETTALETGGGILQALPLLGNEPFILVNADNYFDFNLGQVIQLVPELNANNLLAYLVLVDNPQHHPQGDFVLNSDHDIELIQQTQQATLTFASISLFHPSLFQQALQQYPRGQAIKLSTLLNPFIKLKHVKGLHHKGFWMDIGTPSRLQQLNQILTENKLSTQSITD